MVVAVVASLTMGQIYGPYDCCILTYHDMVPVRDKNSLWFDCTPKELEQQIVSMKNAGVQFVGLRTATAMYVTKKRYAKPAICITFADNYDGFRKHAWPILKKHKIRVTMFVHTGHVGSTKGRPKMTWEALEDLCKHDEFSVASQTVNHPLDLTKVPDSQLRKEFVDSNNVLQKRFGFDYMPVIAYPNGKYDARVGRIAKESGYFFGFTEEQQPVSKARGEMFIPRYVHTKWREALKAALKKS